MSEANKYISLLQERFPNLIIRWNPPPHPIFELDSCTLEFSSKAKPDEILTIPFNEYRCQNTIEANVQVLIDMHGKQLDSLCPPEYMA